MIIIRSFSGGYPLIDSDVRTGSLKVAASEAATRAADYGGAWDDIQVNFGDGSRPMRGAELRAWVVRRHYPECIS